MWDQPGPFRSHSSAKGSAGPPPCLPVTMSMMAMMQLTGMRRVNEDFLSSLETAGTRQLLILLMNFTNVIFRLDYFKPPL